MIFRKGNTKEEFVFDENFGGVVFTFLEALVYSRLATSVKNQQKYQDVIIDTLDIDNDNLIMAPEQWYQVINYQCTPQLTYEEFRKLTFEQLEEIKKKFREVLKERNWLGINMKLYERLTQTSPKLQELLKLVSDFAEQEAIKTTKADS
jgi:hypothetical protein